MRVWIFITAATLLATSCFAQQKTKGSVQPYIITQNTKEKVLQDLLSRSVIECDTTFKRFQDNYKLRRAYVPAVEAFKKMARQCI